MQVRECPTCVAGLLFPRALNIDAHMQQVCDAMTCRNQGSAAVESAGCLLDVGAMTTDCAGHADRGHRASDTRASNRRGQRKTSSSRWHSRSLFLALTRRADSRFAARLQVTAPSLCTARPLQDTRTEQMHRVRQTCRHNRTHLYTDHVALADNKSLSH